MRESLFTTHFDIVNSRWMWLAGPGDLHSTFTTLFRREIIGHAETGDKLAANQRARFVT